MADTSIHPEARVASGGRVAPWLISVILHLLLLWLLAVITWVIAVRGPAETVVTLESGGGGGGAGAERGGGRAGNSAARPQPIPMTPSVDLPVAPAPQAMEAGLQELLSAPEIEGAPGGVDPARALLESLSAGAGSGGGSGGGRGAGAGPGFGDYVGELQQKGLDVVFVLDATNSMGPYIAEAKKRLQSIVDVITGLVPKTRFGIVAYKDYGDEYGPHAVKSLPLGDDIERVRLFINDVVASGGGDLPEPIHEALQVATDRKAMFWGVGRKHVIILIGDSPIHSTGRDEALAFAKAFAKAGGVINVLDAGTANEGQGWREQVQPDLLRVAQAGGGSAFLLRENQSFWRHLIVSTFDKRYEQDVSQIIDKYVKEP